MSAELGSRFWRSGRHLAQSSLADPAPPEMRKAHHQKLNLMFGPYSYSPIGYTPNRTAPPLSYSAMGMDSLPRLKRGRPPCSYRLRRDLPWLFLGFDDAGKLFLHGNKLLVGGFESILQSGFRRFSRECSSFSGYAFERLPHFLGFGSELQRTLNVASPSGLSSKRLLLFNLASTQAGIICRRE